MTRKTMTTLAVAAVLVTGLLTGCSDDESTAPQEVKFASADALVQGLLTYYTGMDPAGYASILHQDFRYVLQPQDLIDCNLAAVNYLDRYQEQNMHNRMFAGLLGFTCGGLPMGAVEGISIPVLSRTTDWGPVTDVNLPFVGSQWADHGFQIVFDHAEGFQSRVEGVLRIYAIDAGLGNDADWKVTGLDHRPVVKASEDRSWGMMRLFYRGEG